MPRFAANLSMLFQEYEFLERFEAAANAGFDYVEYLFPYGWDKTQLSEQLQHSQLKQILFNLPPGDWDAGERGIACLPNRISEFQAGVHQAIDYAAHLNVRKLHCMSGLTNPKLSLSESLETYKHNLVFAAKECQKKGIELLIEPINSRRDMPGYLMNNLDLAIDMIKELKQENLKLQFDLYHIQIIHGDLTTRLEECLDRIGHIQFADNPGRHQPGTGEINLPFLFEKLDQLGYSEWVSAEYLPIDNTQSSLKWFRDYASHKLDSQ